jgi:hypothetical protein
VPALAVLSVARDEADLSFLLVLSDVPAVHQVCWEGLEVNKITSKL